jgi:hypothetical protein
VRAVSVGLVSVTSLLQKLGATPGRWATCATNAEFGDG